MVILGCHLDHIDNWITEMRDTPISDYFLELSCVDPILIHTTYVERHMPLIQMLRKEDTPLVWTILSAGSMCRDMEKGSFCSLPACSQPGSIFIP